MKKYNIIINVMFWALLAVLSFTMIWSYIKYENGIVRMLVNAEDILTKERVIIQKEPVIITETETEIVEWYNFTATGYSANDPAQGTSGKTATGKNIYEGVIAVDPEIIPLGTSVEIKGLGNFVAEDTGGKIKGDRVDIYFNSKQEAISFGKQEIWVRIIDDPSQLVSEVLR